MKPEVEILNEHSLIPLHSSSPSLPVPRDSTVAVGSEIYVIGGVTAPSSSVRILDCRSHTWRDAPNMTVARQKATSVLLEGKIYVLGGLGINLPDNWFEVFDIKTQTWSVLPSPIYEHKELRGHITVNAVRGKLYVSAHKKEFTYEPKGGTGTWKVVGNVSYRMRATCVIENVMYGCTYSGDLMWFDYEGREWIHINGVTYLCKEWYHNRRRGVLGIVNFGVKLVVVLMQRCGEDYKNNKEVEICCAKITLEKRFGGEVWGMTEWFNNVTVGMIVA